MTDSVVVGKVNSEVSERLGCPVALGGFEAEAIRVHQRDDRHLRAAVGQVRAAGAPVVDELNHQKVLVGDVLGVNGSLYTGHHELVLG